MVREYLTVIYSPKEAQYIESIIGTTKYKHRSQICLMFPPLATSHALYIIMGDNVSLTQQLWSMTLITDLGMRTQRLL